MSDAPYNIQDFGPSDLMSSDVVGERRIKVEVKPFDYFIESTLGNIPGSENDRITGRCFKINNTKFETLWDQGGDLVYLTGDTQLDASSTSVLDVGLVLQVQGVGFDGVRKSVNVVLNGTTPVALGDLLYRVNAVLVAVLGSLSSPQGDIYIAVTGATTGGKPDDDAKVQSKIPLSDNDFGEFASDNISHNGFYTVPAGKKLISLVFLGTTEKGCDVRADLRVRVAGGAWLSLFTNWAYQSIVPIEIINRGHIGARSDIQLRVMSGNPLGKYEANFQFLLEDD